jgi:23S rRNA pseudouridine2605 synthase
MATKSSKTPKTTPATKTTKTTKTTKSKKIDKLQPVSAVAESTGPTAEAAPAAEAVKETAFEMAVEAAAIKDLAAEEAETKAEIDEEAEESSELAVTSNTEPEPRPEEAPEPEFTPQPGVPADGSSSVGWKPRPPAKLERLQKILAAAGVASRRSAEAMIEQGRVQVNGKVITELGTKADGGRDHIRVDGKLLQGAERLRYFVLNKPRGFVTTVKDPEGRPTVMQFFDKFKERLYPVGRLDYMSEGLLVVTNDGELANRLTKAYSGVEKTYLVKVAGQPTEAELDILRAGVAIERGKPGSPQVRTSPARIRQVRQGDNPWYEVVLIEGRNRELRKMFEEIGHFVEKIRRVGYGPLVLDQEPGNLRELQPEEVELLKNASEGKLRTPKSKELRRRNLLDAGLLPTVLPKPSSRPRPATPFTDRPAAGRTPAPNSVRSFSRNENERPRWQGTGSPANFGSARPTGRSFDRAPDRPNARPAARPDSRPAWKKDDRPTPARPAFDRPRTGEARPFTPKPAWNKPDLPARPPRPDFKRSSAPPRREALVRDFHRDLSPVRPPNLHIEEITGSERSSYNRPSASRPTSSRPSAPRSLSDRSGPGRPGAERPGPYSSHFERPNSPASPSSARPARGEGGLARPFTTSSGKPRPGGARPSSKPGNFSKPGGFKSYGAKPTGHSSGGPARPPFRRDQGQSSFTPRPPRPFTPRTDGKSSYRFIKAKPYSNSIPRAERNAGTGWKPKTRYGGSGKPASGSRSKPRPGSSAKPSHKVKPGGKKRS